MKIGIDIDDTLTNTVELQKSYWQEYVKNHPNKDYNEEIPKNINTFGYKYIEDYWDLYREPLFYPSFKENASLVTNKLDNDGYELCVITSRPDYKYKDLHKRLEEWFKQNNIPIKTIYTNIKNKGHYCKKKNIDLLIDNDIAQINEANKYKVKAIMFNNLDEYKGLKTTDWLELYEIIKKEFPNK
jgi:hypothetical protein